MHRILIIDKGMGGQMDNVILTSLIPVQRCKLVSHGSKLSRASVTYRCIISRGKSNVFRCSIGNCWDNAVAESFFKALKLELIYYIGPKTMTAAKTEVFEFIEVWRPSLRYNRKRIHASLGYLTPVEYEQKLNQQKKSA